MASWILTMKEVANKLFDLIIKALEFLVKAVSLATAIWSAINNRPKHPGK